MRNVQVAKALGIFSVGLGVVELCAPRWLGRAIGAGERSPRLVRAFGLREIAAGIAILARRRKARGLWARAVGDLFDLTGLIAALRRSSHRGRTALALASVIGAGVLDVTFARRLGRSRLAGLLPA
jgi:hypothetical protein